MLLSASAIGWYGDTGDRRWTSQRRPGSGFLRRLCRALGGGDRAAEEAGVRVAHLRTGLVCGTRRAARPAAAAVRLGLGAPLGSGRQWWSWISLAD